MHAHLRICRLLALLATLGCQPSSTTTPASTTFAGERPISAVATTGMVADLVRGVGGPHVAVRQLLGPGVDPHLYKATRDDVIAIADADIVFYSGLHLEGKMTDTLEQVARTKPVFVVTKELGATELLTDDDDSSGHEDPHVWMDVALWASCAEEVAAQLAKFDPPHAADYQANAANYVAQLKKLDEYGKTATATIPAESRVLITSHDAFRYFGRAYGLEVLGVQGISTDSETGLQRINALVDLIVDRKVQAVFVESSVPPKNVEALVQGARARGYDVQIGGELFSDAMGPAGAYEGTYIGMLDHNLTRVVRALGGDAPASGMQGKLTDE